MFRRVVVPVLAAASIGLAIHAHALPVGNAAVGADNQGVSLHATSYANAGPLAIRQGPQAHSSAMPSGPEDRPESDPWTVSDWFEMALRALAALAAITLIGGLRRR